MMDAGSQGVRKPDTQGGGSFPGRQKVEGRECQLSLRINFFDDFVKG
jgi:hypothetical protein